MKLAKVGERVVQNKLTLLFLGKEVYECPVHACVRSNKNKHLLLTITYKFYLKYLGFINCLDYHVFFLKHGTLDASKL